MSKIRKMIRGVLTLSLTIGVTFETRGETPTVESPSAVRLKVVAAIRVLPSGIEAQPEYMLEFGLPDGLDSAEDALGISISNNFDVAYANFSTIATNLCERMMFLASAWRLGDDYYLKCLDANVDLAQSGALSAEELRWFMKGHRVRRLSYILADRYDQAGVSNIVQKLIVFTGETNKYEKVLTGDAKVEHLEFEQFMSEGPESPLKDE